MVVANERVFDIKCYLYSLSIYISTTVSRNNGDAEWHICTAHTHSHISRESNEWKRASLRCGTRQANVWMNKWTNERRASCVHMSIKYAYLYTFYNHQPPSCWHLDTNRGNGGVVFGWYVDVYSSGSSSSVRMMLVNRLIFEYVGWCVLASVWRCVGLLFLSRLLAGLVAHSSQSCPFVVRLSGRIIDDFLTV